MKLWGSRQRLFRSGWLIAALALLGLNGFHLLALENQKIVGHSPTIKTLRANLLQWENVIKAQAIATDNIPFKPLEVRYPEPRRPRDSAQSPPDTGDALPAEPATTITLPVLKGMLRTVDRRGRQSYLAVMEGRVCQKGDRIGAFVIEQVLRNGVVLSRNGQQWHLNCPAPTYSEDRGD